MKEDIKCYSCSDSLGQTNIAAKVANAKSSALVGRLH